MEELRVCPGKLTGHSERLDSAPAGQKANVGSRRISPKNSEMMLKAKVKTRALAKRAAAILGEEEDKAQLRRITEASLKKSSHKEN